MGNFLSYSNLYVMNDKNSNPELTKHILKHNITPVNIDMLNRHYNKIEDVMSEIKDESAEIKRIKAQKATYEQELLDLEKINKMNNIITYIFIAVIIILALIIIII